MKKLIVLILLLGSMNLVAQEVKTYQQLDNKVKVTVYNGNIIVQEGYLIKDGDKYKNTGIWKQYDIDGNTTLEVKYVKGQRKETIVYQDNKIIQITRKEK